MGIENHIILLLHKLVHYMQQPCAKILTILPLHTSGSGGGGGGGGWGNASEAPLVQNPLSLQPLLRDCQEVINILRNN